MGSEINDNGISFLRITVGFLPLTFGCFLSVLFQGINSLVADELMTDLAIGEGPLGTLNSAFLLAFAACLLPSGIAIDRFGPRTVQSVMMGVTAVGALLFGLSTGPFGLTIGRTLLGVGTASALLAAIKAVVTWCPHERLGLVTGSLLAVAGLGALAAADRAALFGHAYGWGTLYILLAALATICAILTALLVPTPATVTGDVTNQDHGLPFILRDPIFRRFAPLAAVVVGTVWAIQGQWLADWLAAGNGLELTDVIAYISLIAVGQTAGSLVWGVLADWAVRKGLSAASVFVGAVALCVCIQVAAAGGIALPTSIVWGALVAGGAAMLPLVVLLTHFPQAYAARACASVAVLQYVATLFIQLAIGLVVAIWPHEASGQTSATAYASAFMMPIALQLAALAWFLFPRSETRDGAQSAREIAVAFSPLRSASQSLVNLQNLLHNLTQRRGAARVQHPVQGLSKLPSLPGGLPADTAAPPAAPAAEPAGTVEAPTDTPTASASLAAEPADTADARAETVAAPTDAAVEPTGGFVAAGKTTVSPTEAALRSILNAPLGVGLGGALDTTLSASAGRSKRAALAPGTDIDQPAERGLSFPLIAPSHVQALNAVYRRRPPLAATIGGLQASILAAWPLPDRRADASHRVSLRLDGEPGEPGELWLPQSLLDVLVGSVDPALSLDRLGPNRAAIILEFALDSVLAAVEINLGCKIVVEFIFGPGRAAGERWTAATVFHPCDRGAREHRLRIAASPGLRTQACRRA